MKKFIIYFLIVTGIFPSCKKVLDLEDINSYSPDQVWSDPNLANAYVANLYSAFGNWDVGSDRRSDQLAGVLFPSNAITITSAAYSGWDYTSIRLINQAIVDVGSGSLPDATKNEVVAQALFLRAYTYFLMVRAYGGVPYLTVPQDRLEDSLEIPRNSTAECFQLMVKDLDDAIALLPRRIMPTATNWGRIDRTFAQAFKAKILLYKASPQFNPSNQWNNAYWTEAYNANKIAYDSLKTAGFSLVDNYADVALAEKNSEIVFPVVNQFPNKIAVWDHGARPGSVSRGNASACPTWEFVKAYPMLDGKAYNDPTGAYFKTDAEFLQAYWKDRDPRFEKSILWNAKTYPVAGKVAGYRQYTSIGIADALDNYGLNSKSADRSSNNDRYTGFFILKNCKLSLAQPEVQKYDVDYTLMRFAEVMLNYAEAANETGHSIEAIDILKQIRKRAGILPGTDNNYGMKIGSREEIRTTIMNERNIELAFEGFRFWDLRRWRMFNVLDNKIKNGVEAIAIQPDGQDMPLTQAKAAAANNQLKEENFKYSVLQSPQAGVKLNILPESYYFFPIPQSIMARNKRLVQNKDWGGAFMPTL